MAEELDLREEIKRLREEQDRIRREQDRLKQQTDSNAHQKDGESSVAGQKDGKPDAPKQPDSGDKPKEAPKSWVREHVLGSIGIVLLLIAAGIGGFFLWQYLGSYESTDDAQVDAHINSVTSRITGTVVGVDAEDNQVVRAGQTLVDLDPRDYRVAQEQSQAQLAQARAAIAAQNPNVPIAETSQFTQIASANEDVANARAALAGAKQTYASAIAQLRQAEANSANAASDEARYKQLVVKDEVSKEQYDQKLTQEIAQQALVEAQRASADAAKETIAQREAALAQAVQRAREATQNAPRSVAIQRAQLLDREAQLKVAAAQLDQSGLNLTYTKILAPVTGVVGKRSVEVGQSVSPGQQLMGITNLEDIWVTANFKETQLRNVRPNQPVKIHVDAIGADFDGYIESLPGATGAQYSLLPPENATGNYVKVVQRLPVRIRFKSDQPGLERLRPGMSAEPKVLIR